MFRYPLLCYLVLILHVAPLLILQFMLIFSKILLNRLLHEVHEAIQL